MILVCLVKALLKVKKMVIAAVEVIEAVEVPDGREITQQAAFDFLRPKRLLRSLRPLMLSCILRS